MHACLAAGRKGEIHGMQEGLSGAVRQARTDAVRPRPQWGRDTILLWFSHIQDQTANEHLWAHLKIVLARVERPVASAGMM